MVLLLSLHADDTKESNTVEGHAQGIRLTPKLAGGTTPRPQTVYFRVEWSGPILGIQKCLTL